MYFLQTKDEGWNEKMKREELLDDRKFYPRYYFFKFLFYTPHLFTFNTDNI